MLLDEQSRRLTQLFIGNQQYEFNRLFYGVLAYMSKSLRSLILKKTQSHI